MLVLPILTEEEKLYLFGKLHYEDGFPARLEDAQGNIIDIITLTVDWALPRFKTLRFENCNSCGNINSVQVCHSSEVMIGAAMFKKCNSCGDFKTHMDKYFARILELYSIKPPFSN